MRGDAGEADAQPLDAAGEVQRLGGKAARRDVFAEQAGGDGRQAGLAQPVGG